MADSPEKPLAQPKNAELTWEDFISWMVEDRIAEFTERASRRLTDEDIFLPFVRGEEKFLESMNLQAILDLGADHDIELEKFCQALGRCCSEAITSYAQAEELDLDEMAWLEVEATIVSNDPYMAVIEAELVDPLDRPEK